MYIIKKIKYYFKKCFKLNNVNENIKNFDITEELLFPTEDIFLNDIQITKFNNKKYQENKYYQINNLNDNYYNCFESYEEMLKNNK